MSYFRVIEVEIWIELGAFDFACSVVFYVIGSYLEFVVLPFLASRDHLSSLACGSFTYCIILTLILCLSAHLRTSVITMANSANPSLYPYFNGCLFTILILSLTIIHYYYVKYCVYWIIDIDMYSIVGGSIVCLP